MHKIQTVILPCAAHAVIAGFVCLAISGASLASDRLLATAGVTQIEGAAGGGLVPWAVITGYGTGDQTSVTAFHLFFSPAKPVIFCAARCW